MRTVWAYTVILVGIAASVGTPRSASCEEEPREFTLQQLEQRAVATYPEVEAARAAVSRLEAELSEVLWSPFSGLSVSGYLAPTPERRGDALHVAQSDISLSDEWGVYVTTSVRLSIPLYSFGRLPAERDAARLEVAEGQEEVRVVARRIRARVQQAFYALILAEQSLSLLREGQGYIDRANRYIDGNIESEDADLSRSDQLQLQVVSAELEARISDSQRAIRAATAALRLVCELDEDDEIATGPLEPLERELETVDHYREQAFEDHPELAAAIANTGTAVAERRAARSGFFPELRLVGNLDYAYSNVVDDQQSVFASDPFNHFRYGLGIQLAWTLDLMADRARFHQAEAGLREARALEETVRREVSLEVEEAYINVDENQAVLRARQRARRASRGWLVSVMQGIDVGVLDPPELVDALRAYFEQSFLYLQAVSRLNESIHHLDLVIANEIDVVPTEAERENEDSDE